MNVTGTVKFTQGGAILRLDTEAEVTVHPPTATDIKHRVEEGSIAVRPSKANLSKAQVSTQIANVQRGLRLRTGRAGEWSAVAWQRLYAWLASPKKARVELVLPSAPSALPAPANAQLALPAPSASAAAPASSGAAPASSDDSSDTSTDDSSEEGGGVDSDRGDTAESDGNAAEGSEDNNEPAEGESEERVEDKIAAAVAEATAATVCKYEALLRDMSEKLADVSDDMAATEAHA